MVTESIDGLMEVYTKGSGQKVKWQAKEYSSIKDDTINIHIVIYLLMECLNTFLGLLSKTESRDKVRFN